MEVIVCRSQRVVFIGRRPAEFSATDRSTRRRSLQKHSTPGFYFVFEDLSERTETHPAEQHMPLDLPRTPTFRDNRTPACPHISTCKPTVTA